MFVLWPAVFACLFFKANKIVGLCGWLEDVSLGVLVLRALNNPKPVI